MKLGRRGHFVMLVLCVIASGIGAAAVAEIALRAKCYADTERYALAFDCGTTKDLYRFLIFWKGGWIPFHPRWY